MKIINVHPTLLLSLSDLSYRKKVNGSSNSLLGILLGKSVGETISVLYYHYMPLITREKVIHSMELLNTIYKDDYLSVVGVLAEEGVDRSEISAIFENIESFPLLQDPSDLKFMEFNIAALEKDYPIESILKVSRLQRKEPYVFRVRLLEGEKLSVLKSNTSVEESAVAKSNIKKKLEKLQTLKPDDPRLAQFQSSISGSCNETLEIDTTIALASICSSLLRQNLEYSI